MTRLFKSFAFVRRHMAVVLAAAVLGSALIGTAGAVEPPAATLRGTVTWTGGPDSRGTLAVGACPADEQGPACPSRRVVPVAADGSYALPLPLGAPRTWNVSAFVSVGSSSIVGPATTISIPRSPVAPVPLTVTARVVGLRVVDDQGAAFPLGTAAVMATPTAGGDMVVFGADSTGDAVALLDPALEYDLTAFALNTGWPNPWINPDDGTEFHFSTPLIILGADLVEGTTFTVANPANSAPIGTLVHVLDGDGNPFPAGTAAVMAVPTAGGDNIVGTANADGDAWIDLDPTAEYTVNAFATNTGWPNGWISPDGTHFHFSPATTMLGADLVEGTTFVVARPPGISRLVHVLDGDGNPFPLGTAAVMATPTAGGEMIVAPADAAGDVLIGLDPAVTYDVTAFAMNTGWPNPSFVAPDGTEFHNSPTMTVLGADLAEGTTFVVANPGG